MRHACLLVALLLVFTAPVDASRQIEASEPVVVGAVAVAETPEGLRGVSGTVQATALADGSGQVFLDTKPLAQTDMQGSARQAAQVGAALLGRDWRDHDYLVVFRSDSPVIGGPSAGAVMALAITTAIWNLHHPDDPWRIDPGVAATGTVNPDGTIGPVGGVPAKARGAAEAGLGMFLYPAGLERAPQQTPRGFESVDMEDHCRSLGITCHAVATVQDMLRHAAAVRLTMPEAPVPRTADYGPLLEPRVRPEVEALEARLAAAAAALDDASLRRDMRQAVEEDLALAAERLAEAQDALAADRFYTAATRSFQGHVQAGAAENRTRFFASGLDAKPVQDAVAGCEAAVAAVRGHTDGLPQDDINALYAVAAAQRRIQEAEELLEEAQRIQQGAVRREQWTDALFAASFCTERAGTVVWWASLHGLFGPGPDADAAALLEESLERAQELVLYAHDVLGGMGVQLAHGLLEQARRHDASGERPAAILAALEAGVSASVAVQAAGADQVPGAVLEAAAGAASHAVARARAAGAEPFLSVALMELSADLEDPAASLTNLWTARSLALLAVHEPLVPPGIERPPRISEETLTGLAIAFLLGAAVVVAAGAITLLAVGRSVRSAPLRPAARGAGEAWVVMEEQGWARDGAGPWRPGEEPWPPGEGPWPGEEPEWPAEQDASAERPPRRGDPQDRRGGR